MAKFLIVEARFYDHLNDLLIAGAQAALENAGHRADVITSPVRSKFRARSRLRRKAGAMTVLLRLASSSAAKHIISKSLQAKARGD